MNALLDPLGFVADFIAIANALGFETPAQKEQTNRLLREIEAVSGAVEDISDLVAARTDTITNMIATSCAIDVRSRIKDVQKIPSDKLEVLIRLLFCVKNFASNVVLAIIVRYKVPNNVATLGIARTSSDAIEEIVSEMERFLNGVSRVKEEKSVYIIVRMRGKHDSDIENLCSAALFQIATEVCGFSSNIKLDNVRESGNLDAIGTATIALLEPREYEEGLREPTESEKKGTSFSQLRRVFLVGEARTGKSTLGNALMKQETFHVSQGITGTMRIERAERVEEVNNDVWLTEIYDTPGLNDKDGLDVLYEMDIKDHIRIRKRVSTIIMTVSVDAGITQTPLTSLRTYKDLFGDSVASMLLIVLTLNKPASGGDLEETRDLNLPTITRFDSRIKEQNVFCVSLHDLRTNKDTASHRIVDEIASRCRGMPSMLIDSLRLPYRRVCEDLKRMTGDAEKRLKSSMDEGWQDFDHLTEMYEKSSFVKMTSETCGLLDGFVCKRTGGARRAVTIVSAGLVNVIRKNAIHIQTKGKHAKMAWNSFYDEHADNNHNSNLMRLLGDHLNQKDLAVMVHDKGIIHVGTLRVHRHCIIIFHPTYDTHEKLLEYLIDLINEESELGAQVIDELSKLVIPATVRIKRKADREKKKTKGLCGATNRAIKLL